MTNITATPAWPLWQRIGFRFCFLFFGLVVLLINNGAYPLWPLLQEAYNPWLHSFIQWVGKALLKLPYPITVFTNGSGDTTYDWVLLGVIVVLAFAGTVVWTVLGRQQKAYPKLYYWLMVAVRYYVGLMLITYGLVKVVQLQFPKPGLFRLLQAYGHSSPMGLAWTFLGFSKGYNLFMGIAELAAGLLLFRRTVAVGAVICLMTTANVMAINYFYDVPVKIVSTLLVLCTLFILLPYMRPLWQFFIKGMASRLPVLQRPVFAQKWKRIALTVMKVLVLVATIGFGTAEVLSYALPGGSNAARPKYYGLYLIDTFIKNGDTLPPLRTDSTRWYRLAIENDYNCRVVLANDSSLRFNYTADTIANQITFKRFEDSTRKMTLTVLQQPGGQFELSGKNEYGAAIMLKGQRVTNIEEEFLLTSRGFHWVTEYPFNR